MFNIGPGELIVILILALVLLGPEKLPEMARTVGKGMRELRRATEDLKDQVESEFYKLDDQKPTAKPMAKPIVKPPEGPRFAQDAPAQLASPQLPAADAASSAPTIPPAAPSAEPSPPDSPGSSGLRAGADSPKDPEKTA